MTSPRTRPVRRHPSEYSLWMRPRETQRGLKTEALHGWWVSGMEDKENNVVINPLTARRFLADWLAVHCELR